ncbi:MAG: hypothetical protein QXL94_03830 [Candidatus Parvarchaeum sp.]
MKNKVDENLTNLIRRREEVLKKQKEKTDDAVKELIEWFSNNEEVLITFGNNVEEWAKDHKYRQDRTSKQEEDLRNYLKANGVETSSTEFLVEKTEDTIRKALPDDFVFWFFQIKYGSSSEIMLSINKFEDKYGKSVINDAFKEIAVKFIMNKEEK